MPAAKRDPGDQKFVPVFIPAAPDADLSPHPEVGPPKARLRASLTRYGGPRRMQVTAPGLALRGSLRAHVRMRSE
jgi:hypothetical protein